MLFEKYPTSGIQRETQELQKKHNRTMRKEFFGEPFNEKEFVETVTEMFHLGENPTEEELRDVKIFAEYAIPRLTTSSVHRPHLKKIFHGKYTLSKETESELLAGAPAHVDVGHDLIHASVAYIHSEGKNLRPKYNNFDSSLGGSSEDDTDCVKEELVVWVFQGQLAFEEMMNGDLSVNQPLKEWLQKNNQVMEMESMITLLGGEGERILNQPLSFECFLRFIEFLGVWHAGTPAKALEVWNTLDQERSAYFLALVHRIYENAQRENPDQKILLHEWQRLMKPLLARLRNKEAASS